MSFEENQTIRINFLIFYTQQQKNIKNIKNTGKKGIEQMFSLLPLINYKYLSTINFSAKQLCMYCAIHSNIFRGRRGVVFKDMNVSNRISTHRTLVIYTINTVNPLV